MSSNKRLPLLLIAGVVIFGSAMIITLLSKKRAASPTAQTSVARASTQNVAQPQNDRVRQGRPVTDVGAQTRTLKRLHTGVHSHAKTSAAAVAVSDTAREEGGDKDQELSAKGASEIVLRRNGKEIRVQQKREPGERSDQPAEAVRWYLQKRLPKGEKELPVDRYFTALDQIKTMARYSTATNRVLPPPAEADKNPQNAESAPFIWTNLGPGNVGGRTRTLIIDPNNTNIMYAGAVDGGIWRSTNAGTSWVPQDDFMANIAVTCMAMDPTNSQIIYAGTGEGFFNIDAVRGAGIFKTTNGGTTWTRLANTNTSDFFFVQDVVVSPVNASHVYAATSTGVQRSLDGGSNWTTVLISNAANGANGAMDLVMRTDQATDYIFAAVGTFAQSHIWRNTDAGGAGVWADVYTEAAMGRTSLAIAPSNQSIIYAMAAQQGAGSNASYLDGLLAVFRSTATGDAGSWTTQVRNDSVNKQDTLLLSNPIFAAGGATECNNPGGVQFINQGWYHNQLAVDPTDATKVWAAGTDMWRSDNSGVNWGVASYWWLQTNGTPPANGNPQLAHADNHVIAFKPGYNGTSNQTMYVGDDGGIYRTDNAFSGNVGYVTGSTPTGGTITAASPICGTPVASPVSWTPLNNSYQVSQFYEGLPYPNGTTYFGGTQDNGTNRGTDAAGPNAWERIVGGDGGYVAVDLGNTQNLYAETTRLSFRRSTDGGTTFAARTGGISGDVFPFITTFIMDPSNANRIWIGGRFMWRTDTASTMPSGSGWIQTSQQITNGNINAIAIAPTNADLVLAGTASGRVARTTIGTTATSATVWTFINTPRGLNNGTISWIGFDPTDANIAYLTISTFNGTANGSGTNAGHIFKSIDGGQTWTLSDGTGLNTIPDIPAHSIVVVPNNHLRLYAGTDLGVFVSLDGGANWLNESGFPNVVTESLSTNTVAGVTSVFAFTHGRSAYRVSITPSAAPATISGLVTTSEGAPLGGVVMRLSGQALRTAITDNSGGYRFENVDTENFYTVTPEFANYHFSPANRSFSLLGNKTDAVFTASPDGVASVNAIDSNEFFVRQQYRDFLAREPDQGGFNYWSDQLNQCGGNADCLRQRRIDVSAAFFMSQEFQETGSFVYRLYSGALGRQLSYAEFSADRSQVVGGPNLDASKTAFANAFVARAEFVQKYQANTTAESFVDALLQTMRDSASVDLSSQRANLISEYNSGGSLNESRSLVARALGNDATFAGTLYNQSFVLMEYFGYLRRGADQGGYDFWLNVLDNREPGNYRGMVCSFITSSEYQRRFGTVVTRTNAECGR